MTRAVARSVDARCTHTHRIKGLQRAAACTVLLRLFGPHRAGAQRGLPLGGSLTHPWLHRYPSNVPYVTDKEKGELVGGWVRRALREQNQRTASLSSSSPAASSNSSSGGSSGSEGGGLPVGALVYASGEPAGGSSSPREGQGAAVARRRLRGGGGGDGVGMYPSSEEQARFWREQGRIMFSLSYVFDRGCTTGERRRWRRDGRRLRRAHGAVGDSREKSEARRAIRR